MVNNRGTAYLSLPSGTHPWNTIQIGANAIRPYGVHLCTALTQIVRAQYSHKSFAKTKQGRFMNLPYYE